MTPETTAAATASGPATTPDPQLGINELILNHFSRALMSRMFADPNKDLDKECGYPDEITTDMFKISYKRNGFARRIVNFEPKECWVHNPEVYETEEAVDTAFEKAWKSIAKRLNLYEKLERADILSGIGRFGVILLGLDDGATLDQPVAGFQEDLAQLESGSGDDGTPRRKLLFVRVFDESVVTITKTETDTANPRYGLPTEYTLRFQDPATLAIGSLPAGMRTPVTSVDKKVHWHRIVHIADNRETDEIFGAPRLESVYNYLINLRKIVGGSGEMFWKGGFPGFSFELLPGMDPNVELDLDSLKDEVHKYSSGLQRYLALQGLTAKPLSPQVADPNGHLEVNIKAICITKGYPYRIFMGTEEAQLAGAQDNDAWTKRVKGRQVQYLTPLVVQAFVYHLLQAGVLPIPQNRDEETNFPTVSVFWPDLSVKGDKEKAEVAKVRTDALVAYLNGQVSQIVPPREYFMLFFGMTSEEAEMMIDAAKEWLDGSSEDAELKELLDQTAAEAKAAAVPPLLPDGSPNPAFEAESGPQNGDESATEDEPSAGSEDDEEESGLAARGVGTKRTGGKG